MSLNALINVNVLESKLLATPEAIKALLPPTEKALQTTLNARNTLKRIIRREDPRLFAVVGPCSIHDPKAAIEYAARLKALADAVKDEIFIVMRVYFEKPRTTVGWKGLINDPFLNNSFDVEAGLKIARKLLLDIAEIGLPTGTEALDPITPQYLAELVAWSAIGARTVESQTHREMASGLSMPVGFKNGTDGTIQTAIDAMHSALRPHHFLGIDQKGRISTFKTRGNADSHLVLRGGGKKPNYYPEDIAAAEVLLEKAGLHKAIVVDCSHGNSNKDHKRQPAVLREIAEQVAKGKRSIIGFMIESNLEGGNQKLPETLKDLSDLRYGVSVTDACVDWETTETMIRDAQKILKQSCIGSVSFSAESA